MKQNARNQRSTSKAQKTVKNSGSNAFTISSQPSTLVSVLIIIALTILALMAVPYVTGPINEHNLRTELNSINVTVLGDATKETFVTKSLTTDAELTRLYVFQPISSIPDRDVLVTDLKSEGYTLTVNNDAHIEGTREDFKISYSLYNSVTGNEPRPGTGDTGNRILISLIKY